VNELTIGWVILGSRNYGQRMVGDRRRHIECLTTG